MDIHIAESIINTLGNGRSMRRWELSEHVLGELQDSIPHISKEKICETIDELEHNGKLSVSKIGNEATQEAWLYRIVQNQEIKADAGKPLAGCLLEFPTALSSLADVATHGSDKYGRGSWNKVHVQRYIDALMRHVIDMGDKCTAIDEQSGLPHIAHVLWNAAAIIELTDWEK